jgi:hypothetical protein
MLAYGERKTWPLLHAIRSHCVVEMCLEKCVQVSYMMAPDQLLAGLSGAAVLDCCIGAVARRAVQRLRRAVAREAQLKARASLANSSTAQANAAGLVADEVGVVVLWRLWLSHLTHPTPRPPQCAMCCAVAGSRGRARAWASEGAPLPSTQCRRS